jgi:peptide/nickel transport system substrate-binding protein
VNSNYWSKIVSQRISRRRALAATGGTALAAAFLAACGGDDDNDSGAGGGSAGTDKSGLLVKAEDSTSKAKAGGVWPHFVTDEVRTMDPLNNASAGTGINNQAYAYSRFFQWKPGVNQNPIGGEFVPDAAESYEQSPDGLTLTFKLNPNVKFDPRPPTNGRNMTVDDVKFSWDRFSTGGLTRFDYVNSLSPVGPVQSISSTDNRTVVVKLAFPIAGMVSRFAFHRFLSILPKEADGGFNPQTDQRGSGPWMLRKWEPSVGYTYDRNPNWHLRKGQPFFDTIELRLITEAAQRRAQLKAGSLWVLPGPSNNEARSAAGAIDPTEVVGAKKEQPKLSMYDDGFPWGGPNHLAFGFGNAIFQDVRVRRALSMVIDRELWIEANYNVAAFEAEGLPMNQRWNSHYCADDLAYWLDPQGKDLGEGAAYFQFNVEEAKKLMNAAGHTSALKMPGLVQGNGNNQITSLHGMLQASGLSDVAITSIPAAEYNQRVYNGTGKHEGLAMAQNMGVRGDIDQYLSTRWSPGGASGTQSMFPEVYPWYKKAQDLVTAQRQELDDKKRKQILVDLQKEFALQMPTVPYPGAANGFSLAWPQLANFGVFRSVYDFEAVVWTRYWNDESKKPV